jgi:hypothetical protein
MEGYTVGAVERSKDHRSDTTLLGLELAPTRSVEG